jgi:rhomboid protease GluP
MSPGENVEQMDLATDPSVVRRDRLLGALFAADEGACLLQHGSAFSLVVTTSAAVQIFLIPARDRDALERLPKLVGELVGATQGAPVPTHFVAVGGGEAIAAALRAAKPDRSAAKMGFHHVDDASRLAHVAGEKLALMERTAELVRGTEPLGPERIQAALVQGRALALRDRRAVSSLVRARTLVTASIVAVCGALGVLTFLLGRSIKAPLHTLGATSEKLVVQGGEVWRLFASAFLHVNPLHFGMNMLALWTLGGMLEPLFGRRRFFLLYGLAGLGGALATTVFGGDRPSVGASGAIWGLMMAVLAIVLFPRGLLPPLFVARLRTDAWRPLLVNIAISFLPGVDFRAHFGGGVVGFVLTALVLTRGLVPVEHRVDADDAEGKPRPGLTVAAVMIGVLMATSIGVGVFHGVRALEGKGGAAARQEG